MHSTNGNGDSTNGHGRNGQSAGKHALRRPVAVDLFAGAGGLAVGFEQAGFDIVAAVEYDPVHAATHEFNFPRTKVLCADISRLSAERLHTASEAGALAHGNSAWDGELDVIFGGPPCQGFSFIGKRLIDDKRNQLVFHFLRLVTELRPRCFVMENVPGMARGGHASILRQLVLEFEQAGYSVVAPHRVLNACDYGVPQDRSRLFLLGARDGQPLPRYPDPTVRPRPKRPVEGPLQLSVDGVEPLGPSVGDALGDIPDLDRFDELLTSDEVRLDDDCFQEMERSASEYARRLRGSLVDVEDLSYPRRRDPAVLTSSMRTRHTPLSIQRFAETRQGETEPVSRFYRPDWDGLCNTLRAGTGSERGAFTSPRPIHPRLPRVLSNREAARLHSFPDWFRLHATKWNGFRQIGNAVAPLVGRAVAGEVASALRVAPPKPLELMERGDSGLLHVKMSQAAAYFGAERDAIPPPRSRPVRSAALTRT